MKERSTKKGKPGVGKSTVTILLASYLHYVKGKNVAIVDCDTLQHSVNLAASNIKPYA